MPKVESVSASDSPALILDIDGVFVIDIDYPLPEGFIVHPIDTGIAYNPAHGTWLKQASTKADTYYISDRLHESHDLIGKLLGLPEFDWINPYDYRIKGKSNPYIRALAITALFGKRPVAWLDNELSSIELDWAKQRDQAGAPTLLIKTISNQGLQAEHMRTADSWLQTIIAK